MRIESIQAFLTIAEKGSLTKAADVLFVTQPALSHQIAELEEELGDQLIIRKRGVRSVQLTSAGRAFVPLAQKWLSLWSETTSTIAAGKRNTFSFATSVSLGAFTMGPFYQNLVELMPECDFSIYSAPSVTLYSDLESGKLDAALLGLQNLSNSLTPLPIAREPLVFVCTRESHYPNVIDPYILSPEQEVFINWGTEFNMWHEYWFGPNRKHLVDLNTPYLIKDFLVRPGDWAIVPASLASYERSFRKCELVHGPAARTIYFATSLFPKEPYCSILLENLKKFFDASNSYVRV